MPRYRVKNLISNQSDKAETLDLDLVNPWGMVIDNDEIWVADNGTGLLTHYDLQGQPLTPSSVTLRMNVGVATPTGLVINRTRGFVVSNDDRAGASFLISCTEDGVIFGYSPLVDPNTAFVAVDNSDYGSRYKGLTIANGQLYVADFRNKRIDVFDPHFKLLTGFDFVDQSPEDLIPSNFAPFNIVRHGRFLFVLYAEQEPPQETETETEPSHGYVNVFDFDGTFVTRFASHLPLDGPWALVPSPIKFSPSRDDLLIGNFGSGQIEVYSLRGHRRGPLKTKEGILVIEGLWGLALNEAEDALFFASGPDQESNGLIGQIERK